MTEKNRSVTELKISGRSVCVNRPEPVTSKTETAVYTRKFDPQEAVDALINGDYLLIDDYYSSGLAVLNRLKDSLEKIHSGKSFTEQRRFRSEFRELSNRILLLVSNHKLAVKKSPYIGWLEILYTGLDEFLLSFPKIQGLNSAWQWYEKGITMPVIDNKIFPFYGTYFPTRFEHLRLFDQWLTQYPGEKRSAFDIGTGCGVLSFQMLKHGFEKIYATDINPNAFYSVCEHIEKYGLGAKIEPVNGDLFEECPESTELIVFNPPWLPATYNTEGLDKAIYYDDELFTRFFAGAAERLVPGGRVVILFSNLALLTGISASHPVEDELARGGRFMKEMFIQKKADPASKKTRRDGKWRKTEMVELWVLKSLTG